jgi:serine protease AprX
MRLFPILKDMTGAGTATITRRNLTTAVVALLAAVALVVPAHDGSTSTPATSQAAAATQAVGQAAHTTAAAVDSALAAIRTGAVRIIVQKTEGNQAGSVERAVAAMGGHVTRDLSIINGFAATVPATSIAKLATTPGVRVISLDRKMTVQGTTTTTSTKSVYRKVVRADDLNNAGYTGTGVTVALIDTGISAVPDVAGRILTVHDDVTGANSACENMTDESTCDDSFGHGTFVAGVIGGNGASSGGAYQGVAPNVNLLSVKIAGRSGAADVSNVLAAIQWVVSFKDRYNVKVINLSLGTDSTQSYHVDPLDYAVEKAWQAGVTVVVSASNRGPAPQTISKPGDDPFVITVGAVDDQGTAGLGDDAVPNFSSRGPTAADGLPKPDVTAPGAHVVSLRAPGSAIDTQFPNYINGSYRKGSGTSFSTGMVSGAAALIAQANPTATPDRIKYVLTTTARPAASTDPNTVGTGEIDAYSAAFDTMPGLANQGVAPGTGTGTIDASRGTVYVSTDDPLQTVVTSTLTTQLLLWDPLTLFMSWTGSNWYGSNWYGSNWYGSNWYGSNWYGSNWYGSNWYGQPNGSNWYGSNWYGSNWYGAWE